MRRRQNVAGLHGGASEEQRVAAENKGLLLSPADVRLLKNEGIAGAAAVTTLSDDDFRSVGIDVAACRAALQQAERSRQAVEEAAALRRMVGAWRLSPAGVEAICAARVATPGAAAAAATALFGEAHATPAPAQHGLSSIAMGG